MTDKFYKELKQKGKDKIVFQILKNGEWVVCDDISILPYKNTTLGIHLEGMDSFYKDQIKSLQEKVDKQDKIIKELLSAIKTLNGNKEEK